MRTAGGRVVSNLLGLVSTLALARLLTPADFGLVVIATVILAIIQAVTELSLSAALIQHKEPVREHYDTAFTLSIFRSVAIAAVLVAIAYHDDRLIGICFVLGVAALVAGLINPKLVVYRRQLFRDDPAVVVCDGQTGRAGARGAERLALRAPTSVGSLSDREGAAPSASLIVGSHPIGETRRPALQ
jgi:energy-converting hydrogenase Eha subunit A